MSFDQSGRGVRSQIVREDYRRVSIRNAADRLGYLARGCPLFYPPSTCNSQDEPLTLSECHTRMTPGAAVVLDDYAAHFGVARPAVSSS